MAEQVVNESNLYIDNLKVAWVSGTVLSISAGQCRDATDVFDMNVLSPLSLNTAVVGLNGLDVGALAASKMYYVYVIADQTGFNPIGCLMSLSANPVMPFGYNILRQVGWWMTGGASTLLLGYVSGNGNDRRHYYDAIQATAITAGNATSYTAVDLSNLVPALDLMPVTLSIAITPNAAGNALFLRPTGGTGDSYVMKGQVAAVQLLEQVKLMSRLSSAAPKVDYKVSAGTDAAVVSVMGFDYSV